MRWMGAAFFTYCSKYSEVSVPLRKWVSCFSGHFSSSQSLHQCGQVQRAGLRREYADICDVKKCRGLEFEARKLIAAECESINLEANIKLSFGVLEENLRGSDASYFHTQAVTHISL